MIQPICEDAGLFGIPSTRVSVGVVLYVRDHLWLFQVRAVDKINQTVVVEKGSVVPRAPFDETFFIILPLSQCRFPTERELEYYNEQITV